MSTGLELSGWDYEILELVRGPRSHAGVMEGQVDLYYPLREKVRDSESSGQVKMFADHLREISKPLADWLNEMADYGWELVTLLHSESEGYEITAVFKRPANENIVRQLIAANRILRENKQNE